MHRLKNENGFVLVTSLIILLLLVVIGIAATSTSTIELQIAGNDKVGTMAFYAAESARSYVKADPDLYFEENIVADAGRSFPDDSNPAATESIVPGGAQQFNGSVTYRFNRLAPRGAGHDTDTRAHYYDMTCNGFGPNNATRQVEAQFWRLGY